MQCMTSAKTLHVEDLLQRSQIFLALRVSLYISTTIDLPLWG